MTLAELIERVCSDGEEEVRQHWPEGNPRREGSLEGFQIARGLYPTLAGFESVIVARNREDHQAAMAFHGDPGTGALDDYWRRRHATIQIEFVYEVVKVAYAHQGMLPDGEALSARAVARYATVVGPG